jgi:hypothetical protein
LFNRDSQDIPGSWRQPNLAGMSGEERVSAARRVLLSESRLTSAAFPPQADNQDTNDHGFLDAGVIVICVNLGNLWINPFDDHSRPRILAQTFRGLGGQATIGG